MPHDTLPMALKPILLVTAYLLVSHAVPSPSERRKRFGASVTLACDGSAYKGSRADELNVLWQTSEGEIVAHYSHGVHSVGLRFEQRVAFLTEKIRRGDFSITISSLVFSDEDTYECVWNQKQDSEKVLCKVKLYIVEPSFLKSLSVSLGHPVTLPCYGPVPKNVHDNELSVQWKRGTDYIFTLNSGEFTYGKSFTGRASMSLDMIQQGNFSLSLSVIGLADKGIYQCSTGWSKNVTSVSLDVRDPQTLVLVEPGGTFDIIVPRVKVKVFFLKEGTEVLVCTVQDFATCEPTYIAQMAYKEGTLQMRNVKPGDAGRYSVREYYNDFLIKEVSLKVSTEIPQGIYICSMMMSVCLLVLVMKKLRCGPKQVLAICSLCKQRIK